MSRFARYGWGVLAFNLLVILWGAYVRASGSGAGCGAHWPLCNGEVIPRAPSVATLIEYSHRLTSGLALLGVLALLAWTWRACATSTTAGRPETSRFAGTEPITGGIQSRARPTTRRSAWEMIARR